MPCPLCLLDFPHHPHTKEDWELLKSDKKLAAQLYLILKKREKEQQDDLDRLGSDFCG